MLLARVLANHFKMVLDGIILESHNVFSGEDKFWTR